ncbi:MAG: MCE family protein [Pseudonocardiaceae bacterium]
MRVPFRERDPRKLALWGTVVVAIVVTISLLLPQAIFYLKTATYSAEFENAAGLQSGDPVYIAGVPSGKVTELELRGDRVLVHFRMDTARSIGSQTSAGVKIQTVLGKRYLDLRPAGDGELDSDTPIPLTRTEVPFSLDDLSRAAAQTSAEIDLDALKNLMRTLEKDSPDPELVGQAFDGIAKATAVFNKHSEQFIGLLRGAQQVTRNLLGQKNTLVQLLGDADLVASTLAQRRDAIGRLISDVADLSKLVAQFLDTNKPVIESLIARLDVVTTTLKATQQDFNATLKQFAGTVRYISNITGQGQWADVGAPVAGPIPDNVLCVAQLVRC